MLIGRDYTWKEGRTLGLLGGFLLREAEVDDFGSRIESVSGTLGLYGQWISKGWFLDGMLGYTYNAFDNTRRLPSVNRTAVSETDGHQITADVSGGYTFEFGPRDSYRLEPQAGVQFSYLRVKGYSEDGAGGLDLKVEDQDIRSLVSRLGFSISKCFSNERGWIEPQVRAFWYHEFMDDDRSVRTSFQSTAFDPFTVRTEEADRDFAVIGFGIDGSPAGYENFRFFIHYDLQVGQDDFTVHMGTAGIQFYF
jgi:outer membrane lipase/esterase